jgi:hypothetical protein
LGSPRHSTTLVVHGEDGLTDHEPIRERHGTRAVFDVRVSDEPRNEARVQRTNVADGVPNLLRVRADEDAFVQRCHDARPGKTRAAHSFPDLAQGLVTIDPAEMSRSGV